MAGRVYVSFLGTSNYVEFIYKINGIPSSPTRFIQEALVERYCKNWGSDDAILIFATSKARKSNWKDNGHAGETNDLYNQGLETRFKGMTLNSDLRIDCIKIPEVESQEDIWELFNIVNDEIKSYKEIYFDITHAYRFIPMFAMSLFNYSQFVNGTKVVKVKYAMLDNIGDLDEVRKTQLKDRDVQTVLDLTSLTDLQDWTFAAGQYLKSGNVKQLVEMKDKVETEELTSIIDYLGIVIKERQTCRGINIHNSDNLSVLKGKLENYFKNQSDHNYSDKPLHNILGKIDESLKDFKEVPDVMNGFYAAKWCCDNGLYQQAITMLRENFITVFCVRYGLDIKVYDFNRVCVENALNLRSNVKSTIDDCVVFEDKNNPKSEKQKDEYKIIVERVMNDKLLMPINNKKSEVSKLWCAIRSYRNNFNHNGMNEEPIEAEKMENDIIGYVDKTITLFSSIKDLNELQK